MSQWLETLMYQTSQVFLVPTLLAIALLFVYALYALGRFAAAWFQRRGRVPGEHGRDLRAFNLLRWAAAHPAARGDEWDVAAHKLLEVPRIVSRVAPMLGLVATMIPMGPALQGLSNGDLAAVSQNLAVAFSAVILALVSASITFWIVSVQRRWLAEELAWLQARESLAPAMDGGSAAAEGAARDWRQARSAPGAAA